MFIEPLFTEDANIKNELDFPRVEFSRLPDGSLRTFNASFEKALYPDRWSVVIEQSRLYRHLSGSTLAGFDDLEIGTKVAVYRNAEPELVLTPALFLTLPTGSPSVAEHRTKLEPALLFAKGWGDLKWDFLRPLALQGDIGYEASTTGEREIHAIYDMVLEYSIPYLNRFVRNADAGLNTEHSLRRGHSLRAIVGDEVPFIEFNGSTPVRGTVGSTAAFLRPGMLYLGKFFQYGRTDSQAHERAT
jgi:hypothetical protein